MQRLRSRPEYQAVAKGVKAALPGLVLQAAPAGDPTAAPRFGFTVTKKTGNSVVRNRIRRRLKEAVRIRAETAPAGVDFVVIGRRASVSRPFARILEDLAAGLVKTGPRAKILQRVSRATGSPDG